MSDVKECAEYFKSKPGYKRIMYGLYEKYRKNGELRGTVNLKNASREEQKAAGEIIGKEFNSADIKFKAEDFAKGLNRTKYQNTPLKEILEEYFGKKIITKKTESENKERAVSDFFAELCKQTSGTLGGKWLEAVISCKKFGYRTILNEFNLSREKASKIVSSVCKAVNSRVKSEPVQIAVLSAEITGDSHCFDRANASGKLLIKALAYTAGIEIAENCSAEKIKEIYEEFEIEPDSISGAAAAVGIRLYLEDGNEHPAFKAFADLGESCLISSANLASLSCADTTFKIVFVVENQMVFSALSGTAAEHGAAMLCTSGQIKLAGLKLLKMLAESGCKILYAGDFDPEGLQIADKLLKKFAGYDIHAWRMSAEDYGMIAKADVISDSRMKKLNGIESVELIPVANAIKAERKAAYQELLLSKLAEDIVKITESAVSVTQ